MQMSKKEESVSCSNAFQSIAKASGSNVVIDNDLCDDTDDNTVFHIYST